MKPRLIALDVDGTLLRSDRSLSRRTRRAIGWARQTGIHVTLVTGRHQQEVDFLARSLSLSDPVACCNGAVIYHPASGQTISQVAIGHETTICLTRELKLRGLFFYHYLPEGILVERQHARRLKFGALRKAWLTPSHTAGFLRWLMDLRHLRLLTVPDAAAYLEASMAPTTMLNVSGLPAGEAESLRAELERITDYRVSATLTLPHHVDILPMGRSKAAGLADIASLLGIDRSETVAVGDNFNDISMLEFAGLGVAMGNAPGEVRTRAHRVISDNDQDGVAGLIEELLGR